MTTDPATRDARASRGSAVYLRAFFFGGVGGAAPSLLDLAGKAQADALPGSGYYLAVAIFAFLGGVVALAYRENVLHKAFFLGVGAPALIVAGGSAVDAQTPLPEPPAMARPAPPPPDSGSGTPPTRPSAKPTVDPRFSTGLYEALGFDRRAFAERMMAARELPEERVR